MLNLFEKGKVSSSSCLAVTLQWTTAFLSRLNLCSEGVLWGLEGRSVDTEARGFLFAGCAVGTSMEGLCWARIESEQHLCHQSVTSESQQAGLG